MRPHEIAARLEGFEARGPGSDAERRAAGWLARELEDAGHEVRIDTFWCRPNWALAHAWHLGLAIAGSLVAVSEALIGGALLLAALVAIVADALFGVSPGRRLTPERASQNVVARRRAAPGDPPRPVLLVVTANYDAGRTALIYGDTLRSVAVRLRHASRGYGPGWLGWVCLAIAGLLAVAGLRYEGEHSIPLGIVQLALTAFLILALAALLEAAFARYGPAANDNASGAAVAVALVRALDAAPPSQVTVELVLQGAGEGGGIGMQRHLRRRRHPEGRDGDGRRMRLRRNRGTRELDRANGAVLGLAPCGDGDLRWWIGDGSFWPLRYSRRFRTLCASVSRDGQGSPYRGRGATPALPARLAGVPAIALGCLDGRGLAPRSHQDRDHSALLDPAALDQTLEFALILVDALDSFLAETQTRHERVAAPAERGTAARA